MVTTTAEGPGVPPATPEGDGTATCPRSTIAVLVDDADQDAWLGRNITTSAAAVAKVHNSRNKKCKVTFRTVAYRDGNNSAGDTARTLAADDSVLAVIGPDSQAGLTAMAPILTAARIPTIPLGVFDLEASKYTFAGNADAAILAKHVSQYLRSTKNLFKVCVLHDESAASNLLAKDVAKDLDGSFDQACSGKVSNVHVAASKAHTQAPDGVFFAGATKALGDTITALRKERVTAGVYVAPVDSSGLIKDIGSLAAGVTIACPCVAAPQSLRARFDKTSGAFGPFSTEAYDLATILLTGIDGGVRHRADMLHYLRKYDGQGYGGAYRWSKSGTMTAPRIWLYQIGI